MVITATVYCQNVYVVTKTTDPNPFEHKFDNIDSLCDPEIYGTLQWAINKVNSNSGDSRIEFNIPGVGPHEIILNYYLPQIKNATIIDGSTQDGYSYGNPQIVINAQHKHNSIFDVYSTNITIKGLKLTSFAQNGILLHDCSNSLVFENIIYNYSTTSSKTSYSGLFINGCQNVEVYGNNIEVALDETVDPVTKSYGIYLSKSVNCTIGGTDVSMTNTIKNCRNYGVFSRSSQQIKISGNIIFDSEKAIYLDASNDNIQPPEISEYSNGILSGSSLPHSTIEIFGSTGAENVNEYLESVIADENGDWGVDISSELKYFISTQTSSLNNTSMLSNSFINPRTTQLLAMFQNADSVDLDDFLYAKKINGAIKYQFNVMQVDSGVNQIITKDVNFISLLELENNEAYYDKEYKIKVRAIFENDTAEWGNISTLKTIENQIYEYGKIILRTNQGADGIISPYNNEGEIVPVFTEGFAEINQHLNVSKIERTFGLLLSKLPDLYNIYTIEFEQSFSTDSILTYFNDTINFQYVERVPIFKILATGDDPSFQDNTQWHLLQEHLNAMETWAELPDNNNFVTIAIVDDAVRLDHIDLADNIYIDTRELSPEVVNDILTYYDYNDNNFIDANEFVAYCKSIYTPINNLVDVYTYRDYLPTIYTNTDGNGNSINDDIFGYDVADEDLLAQPVIYDFGTNFFHGTHVAGIAAGVTSNAEGIASLSNNKARIIPVKIKKNNNTNPLSFNAPYEGIMYAISVNSDIVNLSIGVNPDVVDINALKNLISSAFNNLGIVFIAASGNTASGLEPPSYFENVVSVGATNQNKLVSEFSNFGPGLDFFAPGSDIYSTSSSNSAPYKLHSGTSMACPQVTALWALLKSINPNATFDEIYNCIASTCIIPENWYTDCNQAPGNMPWSNNVSKHGIINPKNAVLYFNQLSPVAMFEYLESSFCPGPNIEYHFYSTSSGGPITSDMGVLWSCEQEGVQFSSPNDLNTNISFLYEDTCTIVFTIYDTTTNEIKSQYKEDIIVSLPSVEINNTDNFRSCKGFEVSVFLTFSGTPPFKFTYTYDGVYHHEIDNVQTHDYTLFISGSEELNTGSYELKILKVGDNFCINDEETFATPFQIIDCDLCSKKHNSIITWQKGRFLFNNDFVGQYSSQDPTAYAESSCAITNENQEPLLLMKGDNIYNIWSTNYVNITEEFYEQSSTFGESSKEGNLILPHDTGNPDLYYALVVADNGSPFTESLRYYIIDVKDPDSMLFVNTETVSNFDEEIIVACEISDNYGYWILTNTKPLEPSTISSNILNLYKLQNNDLKFVGTINIEYYNTFSHMCFSPNMNLLTIQEEQYKTSIYKFNRELNCPIENRLNLLRTIDHTNIAFFPKFYEFSPNSKLLYTTGGGKLLQFEIYDYGNDEPSHTIGEFFSNMRLGLDNRLYIGRYTNNSIALIGNPNGAGASCSYNNNYQPTEALTTNLSRKTAEIPFKFDIVEEETSGCQVNLVIDNLTGYEPFTYLWNDNSTNNYLNNVGLGEYSVTITDTHGCTLDQTYNVTSLNYPLCNIDLTNNVCFGTTNTGSVVFSITDGTAPYVVELLVAGTVIETQYFDAAGSYSFVNIEVNNYSIRVTDNIGCQNEVFFTIGLANEMELTFSLINMPCENSSNGSASVDVQFGESPYTYIWSNGETTQTAISLTAGNHTVTVVDNNNCSIIGNVNMPAHPTPTLTLSANPATIYSGETSTLTAEISGGTPTYSYAWTPNLPNQATNNVTPITTTTYTLTVTDTHGCTSSDATTVVVENMGLIATYNNPVCQYTQLQLFAQPDGLDYLWTGPNGFTSNEQNPIVTTSANMSNTGTYTLTATTPNEYSNTISIEVEIHSVPEVAIGGNPTVCEGNTLALIGGIDGLAEYHWTGPNGFVSNLQNPIVSTNASTDMEGNYILTVTNEFGCTASAVSNVEVMPIPHNAEFSLPSCIYIDNNYLFTNLGNNDDSFEYTWDFGDETISNQASPNHTFLNQGYHCITLTVENQCGISSYTPPKPVFLYPNICSCEEEYNSPIDRTITGTEAVSWDDSWSPVKKDIIIESGAKLTIDGQTIQFGPEGRIIVKPKGELFINNSSTLQGLESCNNMWQGIEVWGNPMYESESSEQGRVKVAAGENKIKDAHIGILVGARNMDNICDFDLLSAFNSEYSGGYIGNKQSLNFINNGIGIKLLKKYPGGYPGTGTDGAYQMMSFETESGGLLDLNYNSVSGASPYPNIHNPWAGKANSLQRTDAGIWMEGIKFYKLYNSKFTNVQYGILAYNSCLNVIKTNFDNAVYGVRIENSNSELNSGYNIEGCEFKNIIGTGDDALEDFTSAGIFINSSLNTEIHGNIFGIEESPQSENNIGIFTLNSLSMNIYQNKFKNMKKGIFTSNIIITSIFPLMVDTDLPTNKIGAGLKTYYDITGLENWDGNSFEKCNTSVYTFLFNTNLILKCNNCKNDDVNLGAYYVNFKNEGFMANIGAPPQQQSTAFYNSKRPGGNEFTPDYPFYNGFYKTIMSNTEYEYYAHQGPSKVIPTSHNESEIDMSNHIHTSTQQKPANNIACPPPIYLISFPVSLPLVIVEPNGAKNYPYKYLDSLKNNIDSLSFVREDIRQNLDNGKTQELLNDIYGNMSNGRLKNKLIANSPLSDTVLYALMSEYPLSHGNFKNVMTINLPVSKNLTSLFYNVMAQIPQGISKQLIPLQGVNFNYQNITSLNREIEHLNLERGFVLNQLLNRLTDSVNNRRDDALLLLELENTDWAKATLVASYIEDGQYSHAREKLLQIQSNDPLAQDFIDYQNMMLDIYEDNRTVYQMDSTEIAFIRELAYKCPAGIASTNAQAILSLLYRENVPICPTMVGTKSIRINNNNNINDDKYNKPILDIILGDNYPDPASDYTIIPYYLPEDTDGIMEIYDAMGKVIAIYNLYQGDNQLNIDTKNLRPGIYTYTLITKEHGTISKKFIIYK